MPMPRLPATHHSTNAVRNAFHVKKNRATIAPTWNAPRNNEVVQLIGSLNVLSSTNTLIVKLSSRLLLLLTNTKLARGILRLCNTYVILPECVAKLQIVRKNRRNSNAY